MKISNIELTQLLSEIDPFEIDKGCDHITRHCFEYDFTKYLSLYAEIVISRQLKVPHKFVYNHGFDPGETTDIINVDEIFLFFDGEDIATPFQKDLIEEYLKSIVS